MPQRTTDFTNLEKYRIQAGFEVRELARLVNISVTTIWRIERRLPVRRILAAKYLQGLKVDMNLPATFPPGLKIIDMGNKVQVQLSPQE